MITIIMALIGAIVGLVVTFEKRQDADIFTNTESIQITMKEMMKQDKAAGIIANDLKNHKDNRPTHAN